MLRFKDLFGPHRGLANRALLGTALVYNAYILYFLWRLLTGH